ncbi:MAG TPA: class I SAM-dependent methyltransferase [Caulobacteraceae bacterium]|jgi:2-polyprenyl-3-methyl-5-hydroxy-6-metoxy-1,4-benzoquinol methylase/ribosomal protein L40E
MNQPAILLETVACVACGADDARFWARENGYEAVKCRRCGVVYVNPRPPLELISEAARTGLHPTDEGHLNVKAKRSTAKISHYEALVADAFHEELGAPLSWLDVGAGYGELVEAVSGLVAPGSRVLGIEPMAAKAAVAEARNLPVSRTPLSEVTDRFDVVSLINVFSHIPHFRDFGAQVRKRLRPGGHLFLETGNGGDLDRRADYPDRLYLPDHLVFIGVEQMRRLLDGMGFDLVATRALGLSNLARLKNVAKTMVDGRWQLLAALNSPFRTVFYKAKART